MTPQPAVTIETAWLSAHVMAPLGAISRAVNEATGRAILLDPALRDLLIRIGCAVDDVINDIDGTVDDGSYTS